MFHVKAKLCNGLLPHAISFCWLKMAANGYKKRASLCDLVEDDILHTDADSSASDESDVAVDVVCDPVAPLWMMFPWNNDFCAMVWCDCAHAVLLQRCGLF